MAFRNGKMQKSSVPGHKSGPNGSFPTGDPKHARLALAAAPRSEAKGHITKAQEEHIEADARKELGEGKKQATHGKATFKGNVVPNRGVGHAGGSAYGKARGKGGKGAKPRSAAPEFAAGRRSFGGRSFGPFAGGPRAPGLGVAAAPAAPMPDADEAAE